MRLIFLSACILWLAVVNAQTKQYNVGIVAFYNLENIFDTINDPDKNDEDFTPNGAYGYTAEVYKDKLGKLTRVLSEIGTESSPDGFALCGVAEVENRKVLEDLVAQPGLKERGLKIVHYNSPDERGIDVGLLYNPKYFKVKHSESLFVKLESNSSKPYYTRDVLWVSGELAGEMVHVFVNHWPSRRGGEDASAPARAAAASVAKKVIDSLIALNPSTKIVLMGDLNDDPVSPSVAQVLGAVGKKCDVKDGGLYNPWVDFYKKGIGTLAYNDSWNLFDQIIVSSGWLDKDQKGFYYSDARIHNKQYMVTKVGKYKGYPMRTFDSNVYIGGYSDHFPTYCIMLRSVN